MNKTKRRGAISALLDLVKRSSAFLGGKEKRSFYFSPSNGSYITQKGDKTSLVECPSFTQEKTFPVVFMLVNSYFWIGNLTYNVYSFLFSRYNNIKVLG